MRGAEKKEDLDPGESHDVSLGEGWGNAEESNREEGHDVPSGEGKGVGEAGDAHNGLYASPIMIYARLHSENAVHNDICVSS